MDTYMHFANKIRALRKLKGLSQDEFAKIIGVSRSFVATIETGGQEPNLLAVRNMIAHFGIDPRWFFSEKSDPTVPIIDSDRGESGDWETGMPPPEPGMHRVAVYDITASAGSGADVFNQEVKAHVQFPLKMLEEFGAPNDMDIISVRGDSMVPDLADGDQAMVDRSQCTPGDGIYVVCVDDSLFIKRVQMLGTRRANLISSNAAYPPLEVVLPDPTDREDIVQDVARIIGKVVWTGRAS
jgi:phage repressor protein C with HTH and peptisase S24 domain